MFDNDLVVILKNEGGFVDDPDDPGGRTNFGITQETYQNWHDAHYNSSEVVDVKNISTEDVSLIYNGYYVECGADRIGIVNPGLGIQLFDCAVNCGIGTAVKMLQKVLGTLQDGMIGPATLAMVNEESNISCTSLKERYMLARMIYYVKLVLKKPSMNKFLLSWLTRTISTSAGS